MLNIMMTMFQHILILHAAARNLGMTEEEAMSKVEKYAGMMCIPDVLQYAVKGKGVVGDGYAYTHYTDNCYMVYPAFDDISNFTDIHQTEFQTGDVYKGGVPTTPIDFGAFDNMNPNCSGIYALSINTHFNNDAQMRRVLMNELFYYNYQTKEIYCRKTDRAVPLAQSDMLMSCAKKFFNIYWMKQIEEFDRDSLLVAIENSFNNVFDSRLAERAVFDIKATDRNLKAGKDQKALLRKLRTLGITSRDADICNLAWDVLANTKLNTKVFLNTIKQMQQ